MTMPTAEFISAEELGHRLGVSRSTAYNLLDRGEVRSVRVQGRRLVPTDEADRFVAELRSRVEQPS